MSDIVTPPNTPSVPATSPQHKHIFFANLDGLRCVAFALVMVHHNFFPYVDTLSQNNETLLTKILKVLLVAGPTGVSIFFVLSGFLITYLLLHEKELKHRINVPNFYMRRIIRIWPLFFLVLIFHFFAFPLIKTMMGAQATSHSNPLYYFTFLSNFDVIHVEHLFPKQSDPAQTVTWSVSVEEQFYLVWPLLFVILPQKLYKFIFPAVIIASLLFRYLNRNDDITLYYHTLSVISDMAMGGLIAYLAYCSSSFKQFFATLPKPAIVAVYIAGFAWLLFGSDVLRANELKIFFRLISSAFFAFIVLEQNYSEHSFYKFSNHKLFSFWGKYTYGLYLLHEIAITIVIIALRKVLHWPESGELKYTIVKFTLSLALSLAASYASYEYFEKPFLNLKSRFSFR